MKILLVYPKYPDTFWSFKYALKFVSKKASLPPLGLITVAAMLPPEFEKKLVDMNVNKLKDEDILWADYLFLSAMSIQKESAKQVIRRCNELGVKVVAGGPLFTTRQNEFAGVDHFVLNEAEITLSSFIEDLKNGKERHIYKSDQWADLSKTPIPMHNLLDMKKYATMSIQYSRGCPFECDFCNIATLYGRAPRTKNSKQIIAELESIYSMGWRGGLFFVDDNFIGNKVKLKREILPAIIDWMKKKKYPFSFHTEASINLADDEELMQLLIKAGFDTVFIGIESPNEESLIECGKVTNKNRNLIASVKKIQQFGLQVQGGFIVGFDSDPSNIFDRLIEFIQESGITTAMVGLLNAPVGTKLYLRLKSEGRLLNSMSGDNTDFSMNFVPKMSYEALINGYKNIVQSIYTPKHYYTRLKRFLKNYNPIQEKVFHLRYSHIKAGLKSMFILGILRKERFYYWRLFIW